MEGVYVLQKNGKPYYVGTSGRLEKRLAAHGSVCRSFWYQEIGAPERFALEMALVAALRPARNVIGNPEPRGFVMPTGEPSRRRQRRLDCGLTLKTVATRLGVFPSTVHRWERGVIWPHPIMYKAWDAALYREVD